MADITVGAIGAATIAGLVSLLGLVIGKEQKVSEFRQAWIDELRKCLISYLVNINSIADVLRIHANDAVARKAALLPNYRALNEASNGIILRVNSEEKTSRDLLDSMKHFEDMAQSNKNLTPQNISAAEQKFVDAARLLLKFEWRRVKRGESMFVWTKNIVIVLVITMAVIMALLYSLRGESPLENDEGAVHLIDI